MNKGIPVLLCCFLISCDFTPRVYKKIITTQEYLLNQEYKKAAQEFEKIIDNNPNNEIKTKVFFQLGELYSVNLNNNKKALNYYNKVINLDFDQAWSIKSRERIAEISFSNTKNFKESYKNYKKLVENVPRLSKHDFYEFKMYESQYKNNQINEVISGLKKVVLNQSHEYFVPALYLLGQAYFQLENWSQAIKVLSEYVQHEKRKDKIALAKFLIANAYETREELKKAYNLYYSILGDFPNTKIIQNKLNSIYNRRVARKR